MKQEVTDIACPLYTLQSDRCHLYFWQIRVIIYTTRISICKSDIS